MARFEDEEGSEDRWWHRNTVGVGLGVGSRVLGFGGLAIGVGGWNGVFRGRLRLEVRVWDFGAGEGRGGQRA